MYLDTHVVVWLYAGLLDRFGAKATADLNREELIISPMVVIELESEMRGLALSSGVDGILIQWDEDSDSKMNQARDDTERVGGDGIEAGADAVEKGIDNVKGWFKDE